MIAVRLYAREAWEAILRDLECRPLEGKGQLNTAEWWITKWEFLFTVPVDGPDDRCDEMSLARVLDQIERSRPT